VPYLSQVRIGDIPPPGLPPSAIDALGTADYPARLTKRNGYNCVEFAFDPDAAGAGDYALYVYWPDSKSWRPEGPRGATPTRYDTTTVEGRVPIRVSTRITECDVCVVLTTIGGGGVTVDAGLAPVEIQEQNR
jgi:hypothetical protein